MKLKQVGIGPLRYFHKFRLANDSIVEVMVLKDSYDTLSTKNAVIPNYLDTTWIGSAARISFDITSKTLSDGEYATQENGFHWVKIPGYRITKIDPGFIKKDILSKDGEADIEERSEAE